MFESRIRVDTRVEIPKSTDPLAAQDMLIDGITGLVAKLEEVGLGGVEEGNWGSETTVDESGAVTYFTYYFPLDFQRRTILITSPSGKEQVVTGDNLNRRWIEAAIDGEVVRIGPSGYVTVIDGKPVEIWY